MLTSLRRGLSATRRQYVIYVVVYLIWGVTMNTIGRWLRIAEFATWWQVISCYGLYLLPASMLVRRLPLIQQYLYGLLVLAPLELLGYALGTSIAHEGNIIDRVLGERNFTLAMVIFFGWIPPVGNAIVGWLDRRLPARVTLDRSLPTPITSPAAASLPSPQQPLSTL